MPSSDSQLTLAELLRVSPRQTKILAGENLLERTVNWVITLSPSGTIERAISPGDFAILLPPYPPDLPLTLTTLAARGAVGAAIVGSPSPAAVQAAITRSLVLFSLPPDADLREIEETALKLLLNRRAGLQLRAAEIYARLAQMFVEGLGLDAMAAELAGITRKIVLIQDKRLHTIAMCIPPDLEPAWKLIEGELKNPSSLPEQLRDRKRAAQDPSACRQELRAPYARFITPIVAKGMARGFLSLIAASAELDLLDALTAERGAAAGALEMTKAKAVREVEKRVHGDFVDAILAGSLTRAEASVWSKRIGFPESGAYAAITLAWASADHPSWRRLETIVSGEVRAKSSRAHARAREDEIIIFVASDPARGIEAARKLAERVHRLTHSEFQPARLAIGLGRVVSDLLALRESHRQAQQARTLAGRLAEPEPLYFGDLSVYRLLYQLEDSPEFEAYCREILGPLLKYDRDHKSDLLDTLTAFFAHRENLTRTATALHLHRNSLLYRMTRIMDITHWNLDNPETHLAVQLALRAYRLVQAKDE